MTRGKPVSMHSRMKQLEADDGEEEYGCLSKKFSGESTEFLQKNGSCLIRCT